MKRMLSNIFSFNSRLVSIISFNILRSTSNKIIEVNIGKLKANSLTFLISPPITNLFNPRFNPIKPTTSSSLFFSLQSNSFGFFSIHLSKAFNCSLFTKILPLNNITSIDLFLDAIFPPRE